jgi:hypothetical protein
MGSKGAENCCESAIISLLEGIGSAAGLPAAVRTTLIGDTNWQQTDLHQ